jgi:hypothetical protein
VPAGLALASVAPPNFTVEDGASDDDDAAAPFDGVDDAPDSAASIYITIKQSINDTNNIPVCQMKYLFVLLQDELHS